MRKNPQQGQAAKGSQAKFSISGCCPTPPHNEGSHAQLATCCVKLLTLMAQHTRFFFFFATGNRAATL